MKNWSAKLGLVALAFQLSPCVVLADVAAAQPSSPVSRAAEVTALDDAPPAVGTLVLQWTISGRRDPMDCGGLGVERFEISVRSSPTGEEQRAGPCDTFQLSIDLAPGSYTGGAILVDRFDRPVTLSVPLDQVDVVAGRELVESIDFPVAAFL